MTKTDSRGEYCHSQFTASLSRAPTDHVVALDLTIVHPHGQLNQPTDLKTTPSLEDVGR